MILILGSRSVQGITCSTNSVVVAVVAAVVGVDVVVVVVVNVVEFE